MRNYFENVKAAIQMFHAREEAQDGFEYLLVTGAVMVAIIAAILLGLPAQITALATQVIDKIDLMI